MRRQERVLEAIAALTAEHGHSPSYAEIGEAVGLTTRSAVLHHLRRLRADGLVTFSERRPRTVRLVSKAPAKT